MAIYDFNTKNETFLYMHQLLKDLGIKNNTFFLVLIDEGLRGIDPRDPILYQPQYQHFLERIKNECIRNPWYYLREVWRMRTEDGELSKFRLDIGNLSTLFLQMQGFNTYSEKPRQTGKTINEYAHAGYNFNFKSRNSSIGLFHFDDVKIKEMIQGILAQLECLPTYLQFYKNTVKETDKGIVVGMGSTAGKTVKTVEHEILKNRLIGKTCGQTEDSANRAGKGGTNPVQIWDEVAAINHIRVAFAAGFPAQSTAAENAKRAGYPNYIAITTTPPDASKPHGIYLQKFVNDSLKFEPVMFDCSAEDLAAMLKKNADVDFFYVTYQYYELGYSEEWLLGHKKKLDTFMFRRDILLQWIRNYAHSPFTQHDLDTLQQMCDAEKYHAITILKHYILKVYGYKGMTPETTLHYLKNEDMTIGVDVAAGLGGNRDSSTMVASSIETGETLFTFKSNEADSRTFAEIIYFVVKTYCPKAIVVIERNSYGKGVIDELKRTDIEPNLYYTRMSDTQIKDEQMPDKLGNCLYGIFNVAKIRTELLNIILVDMVKNKKRLIKSKDICFEICGLIENNGYITHQSDGHDDLTIGKAFSWYPILKDKDMSFNWNIKIHQFYDDGSDDLYMFENSKANGGRRSREMDIIDDKMKHGVMTTSDLCELLSIDDLMRKHDKDNYRESGSYMNTIIRYSNGETSINPYIGQAQAVQKQFGGGYNNNRNDIISHNYDDPNFNPYG